MSWGAGVAEKVSGATMEQLKFAALIEFVGSSSSTPTKSDASRVNSRVGLSSSGRLMARAAQ